MEAIFAILEVLERFIGTAEGIKLLLSLIRVNEELAIYLNEVVIEVARIMCMLIRHHMGATKEHGMNLESYVASKHKMQTKH